jgi:putative transposase
VNYALIDEQRDEFGVEPICEVLKVAPSAYRRHAARARDPSLLSPRTQRDAELAPKIEQVWNAVHGGLKYARNSPRVK